MVIISASGMCEAGRIQRHLIHTIADPRNIVPFVEFQVPGTLGRRIVDGEGRVEICGHCHSLRAKVCTINALSGHADAYGLLSFFARLGDWLETAFCVHGEPPRCNANAQILKGIGIPNVHNPVLGQRFENV